MIYYFLHMADMHRETVTGGAKILLEHVWCLQQSDHEVTMISPYRCPDWWDSQRAFPWITEEQYMGEAKDGDLCIFTDPSLYDRVVQPGSVPVYMGATSLMATDLEFLSKGMRAFVISPFLRDHFKEKVGREFPVVLPAVDLDIFWPDQRKRKEGTIGCLDLVSTTAWKGYELPLTKRTLRKASGLSPDEFADFLRESDYYFLTSKHDSPGLTVFEAMACGCVVIIWADSLGQTELIEHEKNGLVYNRGEDFDGFLLRYENRKEEIRLRGMDFAQKMNYGRLTEDLLGFLGSLRSCC